MMKINDEVVENNEKREQDVYTVDVRILRLGKWQVPRTAGAIDNHQAYLSMGYFDLFEVLGVSDEGNHVFQRAYNGLLRQKVEKGIDEPLNKKVLEEYTINELILFTNRKDTQLVEDRIKNGEKKVAKAFEGKRIEDFWKEEQLLFFVSLIHIDNDTDVNGVVTRIETIFEGMSYLYYFSFDYSGIVLFVRCESIVEYLEKIFQLNYEKGTETKKLIRDTYSFYGFQKKCLEEKFAEFEGKSYKEFLQQDQETFTAVVNIGVQNYETYKALKAALEKMDVMIDEDTFGMLGRHDISIVKKDATMNWLLYMQYQLDLLTKQYKNSPVKLLSTHETFVKINHLKDYNDIKLEEEKEEKIFKTVKKQIDDVCKKYELALMQSPRKDHGKYYFPIQEIKYSMLSVLKNRFAEDFVLCLYKPFVGFIKYLTDKCNEYDELEVLDNRRDFNQFFTEFYNCMNALVNSAMHSERQFVQATAFDALIHDVPSKIVAYYMSVIDSIKKIMGGESEKEYTFILTPGFSNDILVRIMSYERELTLPHDRILKVEVNEQTLYNPPEMRWQLVHEIAHYLGDNFRNRDYRKKRIIFSIVYIILIRVFHESLVEETVERLDQLVNEITDYLMKREPFCAERNNYSEELYSLSEDIRIKIKEDINIRILITKYIEERIEERTSEGSLSDFLRILFERHGFYADEIYLEPVNLHVMTNMIWMEIDKKLSNLNKEKYAVSEEEDVEIVDFNESDSKNEKMEEIPVAKYAEILINIYCEAYADVQEILITGIEYEEYLSNFLGNEGEKWKLDIKNCFEDMGRIATVSMVMGKLGLWTYHRQKKSEQRHFSNKESGDREREMNNLHGYVQTMITAISNISDEMETVFETLKNEYTDYIIYMLQDDLRKNQDAYEEWPCVVEESDITDFEATLCMELVKYLLRCVRSSMKKYTDLNVRMDIKKLRNTMTAVNECHDIQEVFVIMSQKVNEYKKAIFDIKE